MISYLSLLDMSSAETLAHAPEVLYTRKFIAVVIAIEKMGNNLNVPRQMND